MPSVPTPIRVLLGIAVTAAEEARKLPDSLPNLATTVPMVAVSTAMQTSMRVQQQLASLAAKGDEVLAQLRTSDDAPPWATFDDPPAESAPSGPERSEASDASLARPASAAFDRIAFDDTGFTEGQRSDPDGWDAIGTVDSIDVVESDSGTAPPTTKPAARKATKQTTTKNAAAPEKATAKKATPKKATPKKVAQKSVTKPAAPKTTESDSSAAPNSG